MAKKKLFSINFSSVKAETAINEAQLEFLEYEDEVIQAKVKEILEKQSLVSVGTLKYSIVNNCLNVHGTAEPSK